MLTSPPRTGDNSLVVKRDTTVGGSSKSTSPKPTTAAATATTSAFTFSEVASSSSVKKRSTSRRFRRESSHAARRRPSAADFWANFHYVDVTGSGDDHSRSRRICRRQSTALSSSPGLTREGSTTESRKSTSIKRWRRSSRSIEDAEEGGTGEEEEHFDPKRPYPELAYMSFNCLEQTSPLRQQCIRMIMNPYPTPDD